MRNDSRPQAPDDLNADALHVLVIPAEHFATEAMPLGGIFQLHQVEALSDAGFRAGVINAGMVSPRYLGRRYRYVPYEVIGRTPVYRRFQRSLRIQRFSSLKQAVRRRRDMGVHLYETYQRNHGTPDVVHAHDVLYAGAIAQEIHERYGMPYVLTEHSSLIMREGLHGPGLDIARECATAASAVTAVSSTLAGELQSQLGLPHVEVDVLPNVLDPSFSSGPLPPRHRSPGIRFLTVGSLDENKDQTTLLRAFARRFASQPDVTLRIGGTGPMRGRLRRISSRLGITRQVEFLGSIERRRVREEMRNASCFVLSSRVETFGVVVIEALSCGLPVVSTRSGGPDDIVQPTNGLLVERGDVGGLADAMERVSANLDDYDPSRLRSECIQCFGPEAFVRRARVLFGRATRSADAGGGALR